VTFRLVALRLNQLSVVKYPLDILNIVEIFTDLGYLPGSEKPFAPLDGRNKNKDDKTQRHFRIAAAPSKVTFSDEHSSTHPYNEYAVYFP
jgi:hypothetical protein